jgi:hypothetical protein
MLLIPTASAYSGSRCLDCSGCGDPCENNECRITGGSRRRVARVGATFCYGGQYKNIWYTTSTSESTCHANPNAKSIFAGSMLADFPVSSSLPVAEQNKQKAGLCYDTQPDNTVDTPESRIYTCDGRADGQPYVQMVFQDTRTCLASNFTRNDTGSVHQSCSGGTCTSYPCFCNSDSSMYNPSSECETCDISELQCSDQQRCTLSTDSRCSWSGSSCSCKTGNYKLKSVCIGQALHDAYFEASTYAACNSFTAGAYVKFPISSRRRGGTNCQSQSNSFSRNGTQYNYESKIEVSCTNRTDGQRPITKYYSDTQCAAFLVDGYVDSPGSSETCACMSADDEIKSDCESCSGLLCSTQQACTMSDSGTCAWNPQATSDQCSCASNIFKNEKHCWDGVAADIIYENVADGKTKCATGDNSSVTFARAVSVSDDGSWTTCGSNGFTSGDYRNTLYSHYKEKSCTGVANGQYPKRAYYNNAQCSGTPLAYQDPTSKDQFCQCEIYNGCRPNTTFEKYYCATSGDDSSIIAVGYNDSLCTTLSGVNRTIPSFTDALNPGDHLP